MPYVTQQRRAELAAGATPDNAGDLTYLVTRQVDAYLAAHPERFERYADALAALESTKMELYRRRIAPYEDTKIAAHGDVLTSTDEAELADAAARA